MTKTMNQAAKIRQAEASDLEAILTLLGQVRLPTDGICEHLRHFLILEDGGGTAGVVGLEVYGSHALLRSLAVAPDRRGRGYGSELCRAILEYAYQVGVQDTYLLTETAAPFFAGRGFRTIDRSQAPEVVKTSVEFTSCCPVSAVCMHLRVESPAAVPGPERGRSVMREARASEIKEAVRDRYAGLAAADMPTCGCGSADGLSATSVPAPETARANTSCCPSDALKGKLSACGGYSDTELAAIPRNALSGSLGCGNPLGMAEMQEGQTVLDIGSGAGIDCFLAAGRVGPAGHVIGIDMTDEMLRRARANASAGAYANVEFRRGEAEAMPVADASVDWVISNCVINLSPDKSAVFTEIARVLRPGGRFSISDIVTAGDLPAEIADDLSAWAGCIAGAMPESEYLEGLRRAGLKDVEVSERIIYEKEVLERLLGSCGGSCGPRIGADAQGRSGPMIWSARIIGRK